MDITSPIGTLDERKYYYVNGKGNWFLLLDLLFLEINILFHGSVGDEKQERRIQKPTGKHLEEPGKGVVHSFQALIINFGTLTFLSLS